MLEINNMPAIASGSIMVPPGTKASILIPGGKLTLVFKTDGKEGYNWDSWTLTLTSKENPLGVAFDVPLTGTDGRPIKLSFVVHTIGEGDGAYRVIHYTGYVVTV